MPDVQRRLSHRLARHPSVLAELRQRTIITLAVGFVVGLLVYGLYTQPDTAPAWARVGFAIGAVLTVGLIWDLTLRSMRASRGLTPVVEIDAASLAPGATTSLRVAHAGAAGLQELAAHLVAGSIKIERVHSGPGATGVKAAYRISGEVQHESTLRTWAASELATGGVDQLIPLAIPHDAAGRDWQWQILVVERVARGQVREHGFPLPVATGVRQSPLPVPE